MIKLTKEEKAARYDALQAAIKHTMAIYQKNKERCEKWYDNIDVIGAYNKGMADCYGLVIDNLRRWADS